jgi:hypothetical protein
MAKYASTYDGVPLIVSQILAVEQQVSHIARASHGPEDEHARIKGVGLEKRGVKSGL